MNKKILGILGGMGPLSTSYFFQEILRLTDAKKDSDHLRIIIDNNVDIPSRTRALLYGEESPTKVIHCACLNLKSFGCDYIAVPCNSAHAFFDDVTFGGNIPWVNMIEVVSDYLKNIKIGNTLILGGYCTITEKLYDKYLNNTVYFKDNSLVYELIEDFKINYTNYTKITKLYAKINELNPDCVLLGCSELPMVLNQKMLPQNVSCKVIDGNEIYIKEIIRICGGKVRNE